MRGWTSFYKHKYDEWHVGVPTGTGNFNLALCPDGILPGLSKEDRERVGNRIADCCNALEGMNPDAVAQLVEAARDATLALPVLVTMCKAAHLEQGACAAEAMLDRTRAALANLAGEAAQQEGNG